MRILTAHDAEGKYLLHRGQPAERAARDSHH